MIGKLLNAFLQLVINLVTILLSPIDSLITNLLPDVGNALDYVGNLFSFINNVIGYAIDASGISDVALSLIVSYWVFVIGATFTISTIKLALTWYNYLKP